MNPETRTLLRVDVGVSDQGTSTAREAGDLVDRLMGRKPELRLALIQQNAQFAEGLDISDVAVLREISSRLDLDPDEAERVLAGGDYRRSVDDAWDYSRKLGVTAVPTFLAAGRSVVGAQPYEVLERLVQVAREKGPPDP